MTNLAVVPETKNKATLFVSRNDGKYKGGLINVDSRLIDPDAPGRLNADEFFLASHITKRINAERTCYPSIKTLSNDCGWCVDKTQKVLKSLEVKGIISKQTGGGRYSNLYTVLSPLLKIYLGGKNQGGDTLLPLQGDNSASTHHEIQQAPHHENSNEVLSIQALNREALNREALRNENSINLIFQNLISGLFSEISMYEAEGKAETEIQKKLLGAAREIFEFYRSNKRDFMPAFLKHGISNEKFDPLGFAMNQVYAYADWCRLTGTFTVKSPENVASKIISHDWCSLLIKHCDNNFPEKYDPYFDEDLLSEWVLEHFYTITIAYVDNSDEERVLF